MMLKKLGKAEAEVMLYVRKLLGGESSSVACGGGTRKMRREETGEPLTYASVTVKSPQRVGCGGGERESFDRDEQDSGASGQMQRSHAYGTAA